MHRNWNVIKEILACISDNTAFDNSVETDLKEVLYHIELLKESNYINHNFSLNDSIEFHKLLECIPKMRLTMKGHDLLDCMYYSGFDSVVAGLNKKRINGPLDLIVELTHKLIRKDMMEYLQLTD